METQQNSAPVNKKVKLEDKVVADCCEALIGAVYLDKGFAVTENLILTGYKLCKSCRISKTLFPI